jgi:hypothetical protein
MRRLLLAAALALAATPALAERVCWLSFDTFSAMTAHAEVETCPGQQIRPEQGFCRIAIQGPDLLLYVFRRVEAEACLAQVTRYTVDEFVARFGMSYIRR